MQQVKSFARGNVNINRTAIAGVAEQTEAFDYDATGNWERYQKTTNGASVLDQSRTNNQDNQVVQIDGSASGIGYDLAGNATLLPPTADGDWDGSYQLVWDAWQRLVAIKSEDGTSTVATYGYDGLTRRLLRTVAAVAHQCLYSKEWKPLLEWEPTDPSTTRKAYFWGAMHRDELVLRDRDVGGSLDERLYATHDYFNPTAIADAAGTVQERYAYSAFGVRRIMDAEFASISASAFDWDLAFQGQFRDQESGFYDYGYRYYSPELGRWMSRDPIGEDGGLNTYVTVQNDLVNYVDHLGLLLKTYTAGSAPLSYPAGGGDLSGGTLAHWAEAVQISVSGNTVTLDGRMKIEIAIYYPADKDEQGRTALAHERMHESIHSAWWNALVADINGIEGTYCTAECATIAREVAEAMHAIYTYRSRAGNILFDLEAYPNRLMEKGWTLTYSLAREDALKRADAALKTYEQLENEFRTIGCSKK